MWIYDSVSDKWKSGVNEIGAAAELAPLPSQPGLLVYQSTCPDLSDYCHPGALVVAGRATQPLSSSYLSAVASAGGTVLFYIDPIIDFVQADGYYDDLLINESTFGAAVPHWPGDWQANSWGYLNDFRTEADGGGGVIHDKFGPILEQMISDHSWISGFFIDDTGSKSYFPLLDWDAFGATNRAAYRNGAIGVMSAARDVCNTYDKICITNGVWMAGSANGGGYPTVDAHGCSLADGGCIEHQANASWWGGTYAVGANWATASTVTDGTPFHLAIVNTGDTTAKNAYAAEDSIAWIDEQDGTEYGVYYDPWGSFHATNLPWES